MWFAKNGYVCLIFDSLTRGELPGEHQGLYNGQRWWWISRGYTPAAVECWNAVRSIDYLVSRPEVDRGPHRCYRPLRRRGADVLDCRRRRSCEVCSRRLGDDRLGKQRVPTVSCVSLRLHAADQHLRLGVHDDRCAGCSPALDVREL
jgi:hypothetical protein